MSNLTDNIVYSYLKLKNYRIPKHTIKAAFESQPFIGTLFQIKQVFNFLGIPNIAFEITNTDKNQLIELPVPFISHLKSSSEFILIDEVENNQVKYIDESGKKILDNWTDFESKWSGVALLAFPETYQNNKNSFTITQFAQLLLMLLIMSVISYYSFNLYSIATSWHILILFITKIIGIAISIILLDHEYNMKNSIVESLCSVEKNDCNKLIKSQDSKLFNLISWSELGFVYFTGSVLSLILSIAQNLNNTVTVLLLINIPTLLFSFYSIWYQYYKTNSWCRFCLITIGLFWIEAILFWSTSPVFSVNNFIQDIFPTVIGFGIPIIVLLFIKPVLQKVEELKKVKNELNRIKYNDSVIDTLFQKSELKKLSQNYALTINGETEIPNVLTIVTSPTCPPCAKAHEELVQYFNRCYDDLKIELIFFVHPDVEKDSEKTNVARRITQIYRSKGLDEALDATNAWYKNKNYEIWDKSFPVEDIDVDDILKKQNEWCKLNKIQYTPTILFNGRELPKEYSINDIKYLMT